MTMNEKKNGASKEDVRGQQRVHFFSNNIWILSLIAQYAPSVFVYQIIKILISIVTAYVNVNFTRWILNCVENKSTLQPVILLILSMAGVFIASNLLLALYNIILLPQKQIDVGSRIRERVIQKISKIDQIELQNSDFYNLYTLGLKEIDTRAIEVLNNVSLIITAILEIIVLTGVTATISNGFALFGVVAAIIDVGLGIIRNKINYQQSIAVTPDARKRGYVNRLTYQPEFLSDQKIYPSFATLLIERYRKATCSVKKIILSYSKRILRLDQAQQVPGLLLRQTLPWMFIAFLFYYNHISISEVTVLSVAALSIPAALTSLLTSISSFYTQSLYVANLRRILDYDENTEADRDGTEEPSKMIDISIQHLSFSYSQNSNYVLRDVNMDINYGDKIAIVGCNGTGKSTLLKLLIRLYDTDVGEILINGKNIKNYRIKLLRSRVAFLSQEFKIYSFTIAENVLMRPVATQDDKLLVHEALQKVGLLKKVMSFPNGIDTFITREFDGEGEYLSGGELQKLALARLYIGNYSCIILDEATSALDPVSEEDIIDTILNIFSDKTIVFVSHRLSVVNSVDCVYYFSEGHIKESGTHSELMTKNGEYANFYLKQANKYTV